MNWSGAFSRFTVCLTGALSASVCAASVYSGKIRPIQFSPQKSDYSRGLDASMIHPVEPVAMFDSNDVQKIIPTNLDPNDQAGVGRKILDNSLKHAMDSNMVRQSSIGQTAQTVQKNMQTNMVVASREPNSIQHEFKLAADPMQAQANVSYSGLTNAKVSYRASESKMDFEWREPVSAISTDLVFNHINVPGDRKEIMSLHWTW